MHTSSAHKTIAALSVIAAGVFGCTTVEDIDCGNDSFCHGQSSGMIAPRSVTRTDSALSCDFGEVITARPVVKVTGPAKSKIKYRTYSNAADAVESAFELPDLDCHEQATDIMDRLVLITATHEGKAARKFRFLDIELSDQVDILRTGGMSISSGASSPRR